MNPDDAKFITEDAQAIDKANINPMLDLEQLDRKLR